MVGDRQPFPRAEISAPAFVGREREVESLRRALSRPPAVVLVEGEPGAGKSRLVQEFLASPEGRRHRMLVAVCPPFREALTLGPVVDAVRQSRDGVAGLRLSALTGALRPLLPEWAADLPPSPDPLEDTKAARHRLFRALAELVGALDVTGLVVEDVHWADPVTLEFLLFLAAHRSPEPFNLVVTYRPAEAPPGSLLRRLSSRLPAGTTQVRMALAPLDVAETAGLVSSMLDGEPVSSAFASFLHQRTGGVPLAVEESVRLLSDRADLVRVERVGEVGGEWVRRSLADLQVSPTIRDSVLERVQRLSRPAQDLLQAGAVFAEPTNATVVTEVAGLTDQPAIIEAIGSGLLREDDRARLAFRHAFMGQAVYEAIPGAERRRLHLLAGQALERLEPPSVVQLTRHFREANEVDKWCEYAEQAAARAVASGDRTTATVLLNELLGRVGSGGGSATADLPSATRARLARELAANALVRREAVDELHRRVVGTLRMVLETGLSPTEQADIRSRLGRLLAQQGDLGAAHTMLERAIDHLNHDSAEAARAMTYLGWPHLGPWPASVHLQWLQRAAEIDHTRLSLVDRYALIADRATALLQLGEEAGWQVAGELPGDATGAEVRRLLARGNLNIGYAAVLWGRYEEAKRRFAVAMALADDVHYPRLVTKIGVAQADLTWFTGGWDSLERRAADLTGAEDDPLVYLSATRLAGWLHAAQGARRKAEDCFQAALDGFRELGAAEDVIEPAAALGRLWLADGRVDDALAVTDEPIQPVTAKGIWVWATDIAPVRVEALIAAGQLDEAVELVSSYAQGLNGRAAPAPHAGLVTCQALVASVRGRDAAAEFSRAAQAWDRLPRPYDALRARERQADSLLTTGRVDDGLALLAEVWQGLSDLGARGDADRVARQLREHGVEVRRPWRGGRRGYGSQPSPRELEVVRLVLAGKTNREIADALYKSPRTVAGQLGSVMRKLGVSSRTELAVRVVEAGLIPDDA
jgi:DNA-binding CsgD family transcriptional regulator/tetratricopeptide (TPR) repeat protein